MNKICVQYQDANKLLDDLQSSSSARFVESVDVAVQLGIDVKKGTENVKGVLVLPHGVGREYKVAVFAKDHYVDLAIKNGADVAGLETLVDSVSNGGSGDYDWYIATPDVMGKVSASLARILGPRNLMPNPKLGTVTFEFESLIKDIKKGMVLFKNDKYGIVHSKIGNISFTVDQLVDNFVALMDIIEKLNPKGAKGRYIRKVSFSSTMGCSYILDYK